MPTYPVRALVLSKTKLGEKDLILTLMASDGSQVRAVAKGARSPKSKLGGTCEIFSVIDALIAKGRNLDVISEATGVESNEACRCDLDHSAAADTVCEVLSKMTLPEEPQPHLFDMACAALAAIGRAEGAHIKLFAAAFILKCTSMLGYLPELSACIVCGEPVPTGRESELFSVAQGGVVCEGCVSACPSATVFHGGLIEWVRALLYSKYADIEGFDCTEPVASDTLRFAQRWLREHAGIECKSLAFMFMDL